MHRFTSADDADAMVVACVTATLEVTVLIAAAAEAGEDVVIVAGAGDATPRSMARLPPLDDDEADEGAGLGLGFDHEDAALEGDRVGVLPSPSARAPGVPSCRKRHLLPREQPPGLV